MRFKFIYILVFLTLVLFAGEKVTMAEVVNHVDKDALYIYDYCTGSYMKIKLNEGEDLECRGAQEVKIEDLQGNPKALTQEECNDEDIKVVNITDKKQVLEVYDYSRGKHMYVEIGDDGILKCKDIKIINKKR